MGGQRVRVAACVALVGLVVGSAAGCSGAQGASGRDVGPSSAGTSSPPSASASPTTSGTLDGAARARIPKAARAHTAQGAEAFARFYLEQVNEAWMAPDPELIRPYALQACKTCANYVLTSDWLLDRSFRYDGPPMKLGTSVVAPESRADHVFIELGCNQQRRRVLRADGSIEEQVKHRFGGVQVELMWFDDAWHVREVRVSL